MSKKRKVEKEKEFTKIRFDDPSSPAWKSSHKKGNPRRANDKQKRAYFD
jgi:hypothetical protein